MSILIPREEGLKAEEWSKYTRYSWNPDISNSDLMINSTGSASEIWCRQNPTAHWQIPTCVYFVKISCHCSNIKHSNFQAKIVSWRRGWADGLPWPRNGENYFPSSFALSLKKTQLQLRPVAFNNWGGVSCCESKPLFLAMALCSTWLWVTQNCNMTKICVLFFSCPFFQ